MSRQQRSFRPFFLDRFEPRIVPTVTPIMGAPYIPAGTSVPDDTPISPISSQVTVSASYNHNGDDSDLIHYEVEGPADLVLTYTIHSSPGSHDDNAACQRRTLLVQTIQLNGDGHASFDINVRELVEDGTLKERGQRHFQWDFWVNTANAYEPNDPFVPMTPGVTRDDRFVLYDNFITGERFDYTTDENGRAHR